MIHIMQSINTYISYATPEGVRYAKKYVKQLKAKGVPHKAKESSQGMNVRQWHHFEIEEEEE